MTPNDAAPARAEATAAAAAPAAGATLCPACGKSHPASETAALRRLAATPARLRRLVKGLDAKGFATTYAPGKWSIREILCHLRDCELVFGLRWRFMLAEEQPALTSFDQDHFASGARYSKQDPSRALATLEHLRANNLEMLKLGGKEALARRGIHSDYGAITVGQMARHLLAHDENHLAQIETAREAWRAGRRRTRAKPRRSR